VPEIDELSILLSEKENADERISGYYLIQSTILGLAFSGVIGVLGFVFSKDGIRSEPALTYILLASVAIASIAGLQATVFNGFALGYIHYKQEVLGPRFVKLLGLADNPLLAASHINDSPASRPIMIATRSLILAQSLLGLILFGGALYQFVTRATPEPNRESLIAGFIVSGILLAGSIVAAVEFGRALDKVRNGPAAKTRKPHNPAAPADQKASLPGR
jgi:cation transporter-like permease